MTKTAYYFPHDGNARNDERIIAVRMKYGMEGYGIYFAILERLLESSEHTHVIDYNLIAFDLHVSNAIVKSIVEDFGLFQCTEDGSRFYSESFNNRIQPLDNIRAQRILAGKKSAEKRWGKDENVTVVTEKSNREEKSIVNNNIPPLSPPKGRGKVAAEKTWRDDFEMYLTDLREAYKAIVIDTAYITERAKYHPGVDIKLSLEKACKDFWATEAGWKNKKSRKTVTIDWKSTLSKALDQKCNQVWLQKGETNKYDYGTAKETKIVG